MVVIWEDGIGAQIGNARRIALSFAENSWCTRD